MLAHCGLCQRVVVGSAGYIVIEVHFGHSDLQGIAQGNGFVGYYSWSEGLKAAARLLTSNISGPRTGSAGTIPPSRGQTSTVIVRRLRSYDPR
jgi:hypothetical protein